jgi:5-methylcytosine-specific restriction protein A
MKMLKPRLQAISASWRTGKGSSAERGYGYKWQKARAAYLSAHPLCVMCKAIQRVTAATVVDHIKPHEGNQDLFWDEANWQALCKPHHDTDKAEQEGRHKAKAKFGPDGRVVW